MDLCAYDHPAVLRILKWGDEVMTEDFSSFLTACWSGGPLHPLPHTWFQSAARSQASSATPLFITIRLVNVSESDSISVPVPFNVLHADTQSRDLQSQIRPLRKELVSHVLSLTSRPLGARAVFILSTHPLTNKSVYSTDVWSLDLPKYDQTLSVWEINKYSAVNAGYFHWQEDSSTW